MRAALLLVLIVAAAEPTGTLTLTCDGTVTHQPEGKPEPISMGIIVNFSDRTVQGFGFSGTIKITSMNEAIVAFEGSDPKALTQVTNWSIRGIVDPRDWHIGGDFHNIKP